MTPAAPWAAVAARTSTLVEMVVELRREYLAGVRCPGQPSDDRRHRAGPATRVRPQEPKRAFMLPL